MKLETCYEWSFNTVYQLAVSVSTVIVFRGDKILSGAFKFRQSIWNFLVVLNIRFLGGCMVKELERAP